MFCDGKNFHGPSLNAWKMFAVHLRIRGHFSKHTSIMLSCHSNDTYLRQDNSKRFCTPHVNLQNCCTTPSCQKYFTAPLFHSPPAVIVTNSLIPKPKAPVPGTVVLNQQHIMIITKISKQTSFFDIVTLSSCFSLSWLVLASELLCSPLDEACKVALYIKQMYSTSYK